MKLYAISDLHVGFEPNRRLWTGLGDHRDDWLILGGDLGESFAHLELVLRIATARFARVIWVPGNHELWALPGDAGAPRGEARYRRCVELCRAYGVATPEDPYLAWPGARCLLVPMFLLYDYSFRPDDVAEDQALAWARASGIECADEVLLDPAPYPSRTAWCRARCAETRARLDAIPADHETILINHFPLRRDLARLPAIPRFSIWCGTRATESWHLDYRAQVVISGHLHIRSTQWRDGVRFEEVSLGYPQQRAPHHDLEHYLREILPGPARAADGAGARGAGDAAGARGAADAVDAAGAKR